MAVTIRVRDIAYEPESTPTQVRVRFEIKVESGSTVHRDGVIPYSTAEAEGFDELRIAAHAYNAAKDDYLLERAMRNAQSVVGEVFDPTASAISDIVTAPGQPDVAKPAVVQNIQASEAGGTVTITWDALTDNGQYLRVYEVFEAGPSDTQPLVAAFSKVSETVPGSPTYDHPSPGSGKFWYAVRGIDWFDRPSNAPTPASVTIP